MADTQPQSQPPWPTPPCSQAATVCAILLGIVTFALLYVVADWPWWVAMLAQVFGFVWVARAAAKDRRHLQTHTLNGLPGHLRVVWADYCPCSRTPGTPGTPQRAYRVRSD